MLQEDLQIFTCLHDRSLSGAPFDKRDDVSVRFAIGGLLPSVHVPKSHVIVACTWYGITHQTCHKSVSECEILCTPTLSTVSSFEDTQGTVKLLNNYELSS